MLVRLFKKRKGFIIKKIKLKEDLVVMEART